MLLLLLLLLLLLRLLLLLLLLLLLPLLLLTRTFASPGIAGSALGALVKAAAAAAPSAGALDIARAKRTKAQLSSGASFQSINYFRALTVAEQQAQLLASRGDGGAYRSGGRRAIGGA